MSAAATKTAHAAHVASPGLVVRSLTGHWNRLGIAMHCVAGHEPFAGFRSADLVNTLDAQIRREHCLFALDGPRVVGYLGWAMYDAPVAEALARGGPPPLNALAHGRDVAWILTAVALHRSALANLVRELRARCPDMRVMGIRHKPGGRRVLFDRAAQGRTSSVRAISSRTASSPLVDK